MLIEKALTTKKSILVDPVYLVCGTKLFTDWLFIRLYDGGKALLVSHYMMLTFHLSSG